MPVKPEIKFNVQTNTLVKVTASETQKQNEIATLSDREYPKGTIKKINPMCALFALL